MRTIWTKEEMENVLIQLNNQSYPFKKYRFLKDENDLMLLGSGGYANVYEVERSDMSGERFALKVLGFGEKHVDSEEFRKSVEIQKDLSSFQKDVVKIIDYTELRVYLDEDGLILRVEKMLEKEEAMAEGNCLNLQFVLMEKLIPILTMDRAGKPRLYPEKLAEFDEAEIMRLAHNIGTGLARAHEKKLLHRDVKLENVFYDEKKGVYKLGDFGIAKMTDDGMASTVAFTKGYGAPEVVGAIDERYDNTADIYSFGMMLYLLLNKVKFPNSENYNVNVSVQYSKGYVFPEPECSEFELCNIVSVMCRYDPDERYQSMEQVLDEIETVLIGKNLKLKKGNQKATYVVGTLCYLVGIAMWKLTHIPELRLKIDGWWYAFFVAGVYVYWMNLKKKEHTRLSIALLGIGITMVFFTGFTWWKLILVIGISFSTGSFAGLGTGGIVIVDVLSRLLNSYPTIYNEMKEYNWVALLLLSFAIALLFQSFLLGERDLEMSRKYFMKNGYWRMICMLYGGVLLNGLLYKYMGTWDTMGARVIAMWSEIVGKYNVILLGLCGIVLSVTWDVREKVLRKLERGND